jgi:hypothetical protein
MQGREARLRDLKLRFTSNLEIPRPQRGLGMTPMQLTDDWKPG